MRRMAELVNGLDPRHLVAARAHDRSVACECLSITGYGNGERHRGRRNCAGLAPGAHTRRIEDDRVKIFHSFGPSGRRYRSRCATATGCKPLVAAALAKALRAASSRSNALTVANSAMRSANVPMPEKRSAMCLVPATWAQILAASVFSPDSVACKKAPGGGTTLALPMESIGSRCISTISPWFERRARSCSSATGTRFCLSLSCNGPWPLTSTSRPDAVAVTRMSSVLRRRPRLRQLPGQRAKRLPAKGQATDRNRFRQFYAHGLAETRGGPQAGIAGVKSRAAAAYAMRINEI
jgi:hypothetical protein